MAVAPNSNFIGTGLEFPFNVGSEQGGFSVSASASQSGGMERIIQSIFQILGTSIGERFFFRDFGSRLQELVFEPSDIVLVGMAQRFAKEAIQKWEHRIYIGKIKVTLDRANSILFIDVTFRIRENNASGNYVYPFFLK